MDLASQNRALDSLTNSELLVIIDQIERSSRKYFNKLGGAHVKLMKCYKLIYKAPKLELIHEPL